METLRWLRVIGDTLFAIGIVALGVFVLGLRTGWSLASPDSELEQLVGVFVLGLRTGWSLASPDSELEQLVGEPPGNALNA